MRCNRLFVQFLFSSSFFFLSLEEVGDVREGGRERRCVALFNTAVICACPRHRSSPTL